MDTDDAEFQCGQDKFDNSSISTEDDNANLFLPNYSDSLFSDDSFQCGQNKFKSDSTTDENNNNQVDFSASLFSGNESQTENDAVKDIQAVEPSAVGKRNTNAVDETNTNAVDHTNTKSKSKGKYRSMNLFTLGQILQNDDKTVSFLQDMKLLPKTSKCPNCKTVLSKLYSIRRVGHDRNHFRFQCNRKKSKNSNKNQVALRHGSWFEGGEISFRKSLVLIYCFLNKFSYNLAVQESSISSADETEDEEEKQPLKRRKIETSEETVSDYYNYCREICSEIVSREQSKNKIGGKNFIVEIDEAKFGKRKYNRGRVVEGNWVLGGICRETKQIFLEVVEKRDKQTLVPLIEKHVEKGSVIMTDCWASYNELTKKGYKHMTANHSKNFVDQDTGACTNLIENRWWCIKRQLQATHSRQRNFCLHLTEYMWRTHHQGKDLFEQFLNDLTNLYPV